MIRALRSSFFRFFRTGLFFKSLVFTAVLAFFLIFRTCTEDMNLLPFQQPRFINNNFIMTTLVTLVYVVPFGTAIFATIHTGSDVSFRSINNKIATGISRTQLFLADLTVTLLTTELSVIIQSVIICLFARFAPVKQSIRINSTIINIVLCIMVICAAFSAVYVCLQYFSSNKLLALIISLLIIPALVVSTQLVEGKLDEPYRLYQYEYIEGEEPKVTGWEVNPAYVSGTSREVLTFIYNTTPYTYKFAEADKGALKSETIASGIVFLTATALGLLSINKKEYQ
ncbi:hypothetical protein B0O40_0241 [Ruminococcaceae bacterium R-25]|nr:hypothetical protein B0O40_0241 [Ruminococcaceae bacterium R-25]SUQ10886.1 hypothetical protein SAMN06297423_0241 [Oscillospiraceae bacterium]